MSAPRWKLPLERFRNYVIPLTTPFAPDGSVDCSALRSNVDATLRLPGCGGLYVGSVYQEFWTLSLTERQAVLEAVVDAVEGRVPIIAGVSSTSVHESQELASHAEHHGVDMIMIWPPLFGPRDRRGVYSFYARICSQVSTPVCVYSSTLREIGYYLDRSQLRDLAEIPNILAVKEASFSLTAYLDLLFEIGDQIAISSPFEEYYIVGKMLFPAVAPSFLLGSSRALYMQTQTTSALENVLAAVEKSDFAEAYAHLRAVQPLIEKIQTESFSQGYHPISAVKYALDLLGMTGGPVRAPTPTHTDSTAAALKAALTECRLI